MRKTPLVVTLLAATAVVTAPGGSAAGSTSTLVGGGGTGVVSNGPHVNPRDNGYAAAEFGQQRAPDRFVATWLEGDLAHVQFTEALTPAEMRALKAAVPHPDALAIDVVENSLAELTRIRDEISAERTELLANHSIDVRTVGFKHSTNKVTIGVAGDPAHAEPYFHARYGSGKVTVISRVPKVADRENGGPPWRGGTRILSDFDYGGSGAFGYSTCTSAFVFRKRTTSIINPYVHYLGTAGHCFVEGSLAFDGRNVPIGLITGRFWYDQAPIDFEAVTMETGTKSNLVITDDPRTEKVQASVPYAQEGDSICKAGTTTDETCGVVSEVQQDVTYDGINITIRNMAIGYSPGYFAAPGDSGGPVYSRRYTPAGHIDAYGIVSGTICYEDQGCPEMTFSEVSLIRAATTLEPVSIATP